MKKLMRHRFRAAAILMVLLCSGALAGPAVAETQIDLLVPSASVEYPLLYPNSLSAANAPATLKVTIDAVDPDADDQLPWKYRILWIPGYLENGDPVQLRTVYEANVDELIRWEDERWSEWADWSALGEDREIVFSGLVDGDVWLLAVQVMDRDGAVSLSRDYGTAVANFKVNNLLFQPTVHLSELYLGTAANSRPSDEIAAGQPLNFSWIADASPYNGEIVSYRHGWDLYDVNDPMDPGWEVPAGLAPENLYAAERAFSGGGLHYFYLQVVDNCDNVVLYRWSLEVIPFVAYEDQLPLLLIDQIIDDNSGAWVSETGQALDNEMYRNAYWQFLDSAEGVEDFDWSRDHVDQSEALGVEYSDLVRYRAVLCFARSHANQYFLNNFKAVDGVDRYVWLTPYQQGGGNLFLVGSRSMDSFVEQGPDYWTPFVFESTAPVQDGYVVSYGYVELPDGSVVPRGPRQYQYATVGISALDWTSTSAKTPYGEYSPTSFHRKAECAGLKGVALDAGFRTRHGVAAGALADTMYGDAAIDWQDAFYEATGSLTLTSNLFVHRDDEFVDADIVGHPTAVAAQTCAEGPGGLCVEPMFNGVSRFDYIRQMEWASGNTGWPQNAYAPGELADLCGDLALDELGGVPNSTARTNEQTFGYLSYKTVENKPSGKADAYWGFDPYRFDHEQSKQAVRWVLDYFGLQLRQ